MAGNKTGGLKTADTIKKLYGDDYYKRVGSMGGNAYKSKPHGFMCMTPEQRSAAGKKGGTISRRRPSDVL